MEKEIINIRVLQHDLEDNIRIGVAYPIWDTPEAKDEAVCKVKSMYDKRLNWCGGFAEGATKYYDRIAIVNADTLEVIRLVYSNELKAPRTATIRTFNRTKWH